MKRPDFVDVFEKLHPKLKVVRCVDYNSEYVVVEVVEEYGSINFSDPFYAVNKKTGDVVSFTPAEDPDSYFEAVEKRTLYSYY
jgi:hypothetical protein